MADTCFAKKDFGGKAIYSLFFNSNTLITSMNMFRRNVVEMVYVFFLVIGLTGSHSVFAAGPAAVDLGSADNFTVLAKSGISTTGQTSITGDIGVSPIVASGITGFGLTMDASNIFSTSAIVIGKVYAADYTAPTPATVTTAVNDMQTAYTNAAGRTLPTATELGAGNIGGMTLAPGLYKWGTGVTIPSDLTLSGGANDIWIFQVGQTLSISPATKIVLSGGAQASNIFWVVAGQTTIGTTAVFYGNILDQTAIVLNTGAQLYGRALAQTAVTLDANSVTVPAIVAAAPVPTPIPTPIIPPVQGIVSTTIVNPNIITPVITSAPVSVPTAVLASSSADNGVGIYVAPALAVSRPNRIEPTITLLPVSTFGQPVRAIMVNLKKGNMSSNVKILQEFLILEHTGLASEALAKVGATSYFGVLTRAALAEFQLKAGISPAWGNFGSITRAYIQAYLN